MKNKRNKVVVSIPDEYWKKKLKFDMHIENLRFKKLCGIRLSRKDIRKLKDLYFTTYHDWEIYISMSIHDLDISELREYSKFLNFKEKTSTAAGGVPLSFIASLLITLFNCILLTPIVNYILKNIYSPISASIGFIMLTVFTWFLCYCIITFLTTAKHIEANQLFYKDIKDIVDKRILDLEEKSLTDM